MEVTDKIMYHFVDDCYLEKWKVGKEIIVDDNYNSLFCSILDNFSTGVNITSKKRVSFNKVLQKYRTEEKDEFSEMMYPPLLYDAENLIRRVNILNRERALEDCRKDNYSDLPSRLHSIWLINENSISFWNIYFSKRKLFKVSVTGELFKSSDMFIPDDEMTMKEMYERAKKYWNPVFITSEDELKSEYLFQGKIKILEEINLAKKK